MKVFSILLALVNSVMSGLVVLSCISTGNLQGGELGWLVARATTGITVMLIGLLTFRDGMQQVGPGKMLLAGVALVLLGTGSAMWGVHLSIIGGDIKNAIILFGGSLVLQGIASLIGLQESQQMVV